MDEIGLVKHPDALTDQTDWLDGTYRTGSTPTYAPIWDPEKPDRFYNIFYGLNQIPAFN